MRLPSDIALYILVLVSLVIYKSMESSTMIPTFFTSYFEDILALPVILKSALLGVQVLAPSWRTYRFSLRELTLITLLFSIYFEWLLPMKDSRFTADIIDVGCYILGALVFWKWMNFPFTFLSRSHGSTDG